MASHLTTPLTVSAPWSHLHFSLLCSTHTVFSKVLQKHPDGLPPQDLHTACSSAWSVLLQTAALLTPSSPRRFLLKRQGLPWPLCLKLRPFPPSPKYSLSPALLCHLKALFFSLFIPKHAIYFYYLLSISYLLPLGCENFHSKCLAFAHF